MSVYTPDVWVRIRITSSEGTYDKILAGWYGGYAGSDRWKLNSGITGIIEKDDHWVVEGFSGSTYICYKDVERLSGYTANVFSSFLDDIKLVGGNIEIVPMSTEFASA